MKYKPWRDENGELVLQVTKHAQNLIHNPLLNKGTAFPQLEREDFDLEGLLPPHISTIDEQLKRVKDNYDREPNNIEKYVYLRALQDRNETLFYALVRKYITEMLPIIYTPTVGEAVQKYGHIYRNARGLFITPENVHRMDEFSERLPIHKEEVEMIVVTDSQGILGIGDQGVGGMAIPIGKLSLYTVAAGIHPACCLPVTLDVGTDNQKLLDDPMYLGLKRSRMSGEEYDKFISTFVEGVNRNFPNAILQWEDFSKANAFKNMDDYKEAHPSFNDDIEGTGAITLAGIIGAMKVKKEKLTDQVYCIYGAGAAGIGIARQIREALKLDGMDPQEAADRVFVVDSRGLIADDREGLDEYKREFAKPERVTAEWLMEDLHQYSLADVIKNGKVTVLIGVSGQANSITDSLVDLMLANNPQPVIFPLSNPTSNAEADPRWILEYTNGQAVVAAGSPFDNVTVNGRTFYIGQGNNALVFPGVGLGAAAAKVRVIRASLFTAAAHAVADALPEERLKARTVYPDVSQLFDVSLKVAVAVYHQALEDGDGQELEGDPEEEIRKRMWIPEYPRYIR